MTFTKEKEGERRRTGAEITFSNSLLYLERRKKKQREVGGGTGERMRI
jgi:hypothetical protein